MDFVLLAITGATLLGVYAIWHRLQTPPGNTDTTAAVRRLEEITARLQSQTETTTRIEPDQP